MKKKLSVKKLVVVRAKPSKSDRAPTGKSLLPGMIRAAHASGAILRKYYSRTSDASLKISEKKDAGLVTNADIESEKKCVAILRRLRPDFGFLTEEATIATTAHLPGRFVIDPLDGTTNFVHGFPMFCVSIGAEWEGKVIAAVIYHPVLKETYTATLGGGAFINGKRMRVSDTAKVSDSLLATGFATNRRDSLLRIAEMQAFDEITNSARAVRRPGAAALDLAYTARGIFDGFWERNLAPWDTAAGLLLVEEAGGKVTDLGGHPYSITSPGILATNGKLHPTLLERVAIDVNPD